MTGEKGGLLAGLRAEALKSRHAAPVRLAVLMALPMPLLGAMPYRGVQIFSAWNYWYALFLPVSLSLVVACVARADARTRMRGLLGLGFPLGRAWWAKALWCLALCTLSNLVVFGIYLAGSAFSSQGLTAAGTLTMLLCALANTVTVSCVKISDRIRRPFSRRPSSSCGLAVWRRPRAASSSRRIRPSPRPGSCTRSTSGGGGGCTGTR